MHFSSVWAKFSMMTMAFDARILELVLELARRVQRVDVDHHVAGAQDGGHHHRILRHVGHHDGHAVALDQAQALQVGRKGAAQAVGFAVTLSSLPMKL